MVNDLVTKLNVVAQLFDICIASLNIKIRALSEHFIEIACWGISTELLSDANPMLFNLFRRHFLYKLVVMIVIIVILIGYRCNPFGSVLQDLIYYRPLLNLNLIIRQAVFT